MTEKGLFNFLDWFNFFDNLELLGAIEQYFRGYVEKNESFTPSYWELAYYWELADKYKEAKKINRF